MRSRYAAFALGDLDHIFSTWHPRTRPEVIEPDPGLAWTRLEILDTTDTEVAFRASYLRDGVPGVRRERSRFEQRAGRWVYVDGTTD